MTTDHGFQIPWALVRLVDPDAPGCNRCKGPALLEFNADFRRTGIVIPQNADEVPQVQETEVKTPIFACKEHAGELAFAAAYTVATGPTGAV
mgnify:CR=1 FL=1